MSDTLFIAVSALAAYLLGSVNSAVLVSRMVLGRDIRELGSGNAGFTNSMRAMGRRWAFVVITGDLLKGALAILFAGLLLYGSAYYGLGRACAALCVLLGHAYPVFFGFRGGKGIATTAAVVLIFDWRVGLLALGLYIVIVTITRYSSLGSLTAAASLPFLMLVFHRDDWLIIAVTAVIAALLIFWHRSNIMRLIRGTENKMTSRKRG